jgi:3-methyladenine DNA glycosylase/8-oxoguanine DNA glycosylase
MHARALEVVPYRRSGAFGLLAYTTMPHATPPFSLKATALSHGWHECSPMSWCEGGRCFQTIERDGTGVYRISVTQGSSSKRKVNLHVTIDGESVDDALVARFKKHIRLILGLDEDLSEFYAICADHPMLRVIPKIGAGRGLRSVSMAENIIKVLCSTNVNWTQAVKMINRLV